MQIGQNANKTLYKKTKFKSDKMQIGQNANETQCKCDKIQM